MNIFAHAGAWIGYGMHYCYRNNRKIIISTFMSFAIQKILGRVHVFLIKNNKLNNIGNNIICYLRHFTNCNMLLSFYASSYFVFIKLSKDIPDFKDCRFNDYLDLLTNITLYNFCCCKATKEMCEETRIIEEDKFSYRSMIRLQIAIDNPTFVPFEENEHAIDNPVFVPFEENEHAIKKLTPEEIDAIAPLRCKGLDNIITNEKEFSNPTHCSICMGEYDNSQLSRTLPCKHSFHAHCVDEWLRISNATCPICRKNLTTTKSFVS